MRKTVKKVLVVLMVVGAGIQFIRPEASNPPEQYRLESDTPVPVVKILRRSCGDCHTHSTVWPWYSHVAPVSWLVRNHVNKARKKMDFSKWAPDPHELGAICREISSGAMPMPSYLWIHRDAKLSPAEIKLICDWTREASK